MKKEGELRADAKNLLRESNRFRFAKNEGGFEKSKYFDWYRNNLKAYTALATIADDLFLIASSETKEERKVWLKKFANEIALNRRQFETRIDPETFEDVAIEKPLKWDMARRDFYGGKDIDQKAPFFWNVAQKLGRAIASNPMRLKFCPYCHVMFWDSQTKNANQRICGSDACQKDWSKQRSLDSYYKIKRSK